MKRPLLLPLLLCAGVGTLAATPTDDVLPRPPAADRYLKMADRSPFAPPTVGPVVTPTPPPAAGPKWSDSLSVGLVTQQGGTFFATINDKTKNEHFLLQSNKVDTDRQLSIMTVQWGETLDQTLVTLRHNNDTATLHFDPSASASSVAAAPVGLTPGFNRPGGGGVPTLPPGMATGQPRFTPPPPPPNLPGNNIQRRAAPIRTSATVTAPVIRPQPQAQPRRPVATRDEDEE